MIAHDVEQNSDEWYSLRSGIPTASAFKKLVTSKGVISKQLNDYGHQLGGEKYTGKPLEDFAGNAWTDRGLELEGAAIKLYEFTNEVKTEEVGFITDDKKTMGCSPDRLVGDDGMLEIKCLKASTHIETILYFQKHKKAPPAYYQQTQGQMMIAERQWCDLYFYYPELPPLTIRAVPDADFQASLLVAIGKLKEASDEAYEAIKAIS